MNYSLVWKYLEREMKRYNRSVWCTLLYGRNNILIVLILNIILWNVCITNNGITLDSKYISTRYIRILCTPDIIDNVVNVKIEEEENINKENDNVIKSIKSIKYPDNVNLYNALRKKIRKNMEQNKYGFVPYSNEHLIPFYNEKDNSINNDIDSLDGRDNLIRLKMYNIWLELMQNEQMKYYGIRHSLNKFYKNLNQKYNIKIESNDKALKECNEIICLSAHYLQRHLNNMFNEWFKKGFVSIGEFQNIINATRHGWKVLTTNVKKKYKDILTDNLIEKMNKPYFIGDNIFNSYLDHINVKDNTQQYNENMKKMSCIEKMPITEKEGNMEMNYNNNLNVKDKKLLYDNIVKNNSTIKNYTECLKMAEYVDVDTSGVRVKEENNMMKRNIRRNNNIYKINNEEISNNVEKSNNIEKEDNQNINYNDGEELNETDKNEIYNNNIEKGDNQNINYNDGEELNETDKNEIYNNNIEKGDNQNINYNDDEELNETDKNEFYNNDEENENDDIEISLEDIFDKSTNIIKEAEEIINKRENGTSIDSCVFIDKPEDYDKQIECMNNNNTNGYLDYCNKKFCNENNSNPTYLQRKWKSLTHISDKDKSSNNIISSIWKYVSNKNNLLYWRKFNTY
ncbi:hypothetical protein PFBG_04145 [Plasmodium falciparum 7G8]|uniref:Plasmodium RESA N-terminal domain-containing protein n=1 Tax=Plasmodium falciparum (isolate 7G8) TaxID=57266 RepID=W7EX51_PLAF8|nr:hypothetical protein PFBG_04145 [Plasmodium falciparum 7G8]